jgi:diguanylate cyclase (GGDEF)-like protein
VRLPEALRRPAGAVEGMRWLYALTAVLALLLCLPAPLSTATPATAALALGGGAVLITSWLVTYRRRGSSLASGVIDAVGLMLFTLACPAPAVAFSFAFSGLWFRALYGSVTRAVVLCAFYAAGLTAALALWGVVPGDRPMPDPLPILGTFPCMFLVVIVGRLLAAGLFAREEAAVRDAAIVRFGTAMLEAPDSEVVLQLAGDACREICAATPGLRLIAAFRTSSGDLTARTAGPFADRIESLPAGVLTGAGDDVVITDPAGLDAAAGETCAWTAVEIPDEPAGAWMLIGAPKRVPTEAVLAVRSLSNQVTLALRNSGVRRELTRQARTDALTGLANRAAFTRTVRAALDEDAAGPVALLFVDLDDFKPVNDRYGHRAGDELLAQVAQRLAALGGVCGRLGGDEFAILLTGADGDTADRTAADVVAAVAEPFPVAGTTVRVGASVGVALAEAGSGVDAEQLLHQGDVAMYRAKAQGKNGVGRYGAVPAPA